eukprot:gene675-8176_t
MIKDTFSEKKEQKDIPTFKIILTGDAGVGKTSYIKQLFKNEFEKKYISTITTEVHKIIFKTNKGGTICFNIWNPAGSEKFGYLRDGYYFESDAAIIMFDLTSRCTYKNTPNWYRDITRVCNDIPIVMCGNKFDMENETKIKSKQMVFPAKKNIPYFTISVKSQANIYEPLLNIARKLLNDQQLYFEFSADEEIEIEDSEISEKIKLFDEQLYCSIPMPEDDF